MFTNMKEDHHELLEIHYFTPTPLEKAGPVWPIRLGANIAKPNYHIGPRITPYYYLIMVLEGEGVLHQNNGTYPLRKNDIYCLYPQVTHEYYTNADAPLRKAFLAFDGKQSVQLLERAGLYPDKPHRSGGANEGAIEEMRQFFKLVADAERPHTDLSRLAQTYRLFDVLAADRLTGKNGRPAHAPVSWLLGGKAYMDIHFADGITVENIARHVGVDRTHFTKEFHKTFGQSPLKYLQQLRMREAELLLQGTSYTLSEIALSVGYSDLPTFSKAFKKLRGVSPSDFRRLNLQR